MLSARFEGNQLPLGELVAPCFVGPTPVSGVVSLNTTAQADLRQASNPRAWTVTGRAQSIHPAYREAALDSLAFGFHLKDGHLDLPELRAHLKGQPLVANGGVDLFPPYAIDVKMRISEWDLSTVLAMLPAAPQSLAIAGSLTAETVARGTLSPIAIQTTGDGRLGRFQAVHISFGDVPFHWSCDRDEVAISGVEAHVFGGRFLADARVPLTASGTTRGSARVSGLDTAKLVSALQTRSLKVTGIAAGRVEFVIPHDVARVEATLKLSAPDLTVQGLTAEHVLASVRAHKGAVNYELTAATLGGDIKFAGNYPLNVPSAKAVANGKLKVDGFSLAEIWKELRVTGAAAHLLGRGGFDATLRAARTSGGEGVWAQGVAEFSDLSWGPHLPLGHLRGTVAVTPTSWRIEPLSGELLSGATSGFIWGTNPTKGSRRMGFDLRVDLACGTLKDTLAFIPDVASKLSGHGTLMMAGNFDETLRANAELTVTQAKFAGFPLNELHALRPSWFLLRVPGRVSCMSVTGPPGSPEVMPAATPCSGSARTARSRATFDS